MGEVKLLFLKMGSDSMNPETADNVRINWLNNGWSGNWLYLKMTFLRQVWIYNHEVLIGFMAYEGFKINVILIERR